MIHYVQRGLFVCLLGLLLVAPQGAKANGEAELRAQLYALILELENRLSVLQAAQLQDPVLPVDESFLDAIDATVLARYQVDTLTIDSPVRSHRQYANRLFELVPEDYHELIVELTFFTSDSNIDGFVETVAPYRGEWRYGAHTAMLDEPLSGELNTELIVHEFAHLFSLDQVFTTRAPRQCHEFIEEDSGCVALSTLYGAFVDEFWTDDQLDEALDIREARDQEAAFIAFYEDNQYDFVSEYAASSPAEDFAESFMYFVLAPEPVRGRVAREKVSFFDRYSRTRAYKEEILSNR